MARISPWISAWRPSPNAGGLSPLGRRRHYRHQIQSLAYVNLDQGNGGIIRNLGDSGIAIQAVAPLVVNQQVFLRFELSNPRVRVEATGRVAWVDPMGQAGMEFLSLPQRSGRLLKEWIFVQLMALAQHSAGDSAPALRQEQRGGCGAAVFLGSASRDPPGTGSGHRTVERKRQSGASALASVCDFTLPLFRFWWMD